MNSASQLWSGMRAKRPHDRAVNDAACLWFFLLAAFAVWAALGHFRDIAGSEPTLLNCANLAARLTAAALYVSFAWFMLHRSPPLAHMRGVAPSLAAFAGTYLPWSLILITVDRDPQDQSILPTALMLLGSGGALATIAYLGRSFSIVPRAQQLVRTGPYSLVRHPLYLAEEVALLGCLLKFYSLAALALFAVHLVLQIARMLFEENLLRRCFPEYADYAHSTWRLIPCLW
jgi:protein-S-isoprenylcysteine O-methyltransferase Ste14